MIHAASAFPLLAIAQLAPMLAHGQIEIGTTLVFTARVVYVMAMGAYMAWLTAVAPLPAPLNRGMAITLAGGILAIFLPRSASVPIIWAMQLAILAALATWAYVARGDRWMLAFLGLTVGAHGIGALTIYPLCQIGASPELLALPTAGYVCNVVLPPVWAGLVPAGLGFVAWVLVVNLAVRRGRV